MEKCLHVSKIRPAWDHSILNPEKWMCYICGTTESVWACLSCSNVACGRFNEKHALIHYQDSKHPISIEVNEKYVYCYVCDDYVLNDNAAGDLKLLRSALSAIATQKFTDIESRGRRLLRSYSYAGATRTNTDDDDKLATAIWHERQSLLARTFSSWRAYYRKQKAAKQATPRKWFREEAVSVPQLVRMRTLVPGVTGLRNLGNTCYMNSILQVLSHIELFRAFFLNLKFKIDVSQQESLQVTQAPVPSPSTSTAWPPASNSMPGQHYTRQSTIDCFQHLMTSSTPYTSGTPKRRPGGLNGGATPSTTVAARRQLICDVESKDTSSRIWLCAELHGLLRVLWSGKWAQVSPHAFLQAVWQAIPMFKGYAQHDAQEFLCELLDKVQRELDASPNTSRAVNQTRRNSVLLEEIFQGQLVSQVTCLACGNASQTYEPYMDLSLEFPNRYQITKQNSRVAQDICHITEMLAKFTEEEFLEGAIYACQKCNRRKKSKRALKETLYTKAKKQLLINKLPKILRLHLKRFRWSGRDHREKISTHVAADEVLDLKPFCSAGDSKQSYNYELFGVVIHHGRGFGSGHYTAYAWNHEAASWVHCNDSRMTLAHLEDVLKAQAYILFYRQLEKTQPQLNTKPAVDLRSETSDCKVVLEDIAHSRFKSKDRRQTQHNDVSVVSEDSDSEISFRFKSPVTRTHTKGSRGRSPRPGTSDTRQNSTRARVGKRSLDSTSVSSQPAKKKKTSIANVASGKSPKLSPKLVRDVKKSLLYGKRKLERVINSSNSALDKSAAAGHCVHLKRRKSTFW